MRYSITPLELSPLPQSDPTEPLPPLQKPHTPCSFWIYIVIQYGQELARYFFLSLRDKWVSIYASLGWRFTPPLRGQLIDYLQDLHKNGVIDQAAIFGIKGDSCWAVSGQFTVSTHSYLDLWLFDAPLKWNYPMDTIILPSKLDDCA